MRIAVIGGGYTGLTAAYDLVKNGHDVTVFEKEKNVGGLANGFTQKNWSWPLEKSYHHFFSDDNVLLSLMDELGIGNDWMLKKPLTATLINPQSPINNQQSAMFPLDSAMNLLAFTPLPVFDRLRTGALIAFCKFFPFWQILEGMSAKEFFTIVGGPAGWKIIWEPLMTGKFGNYADTISASWLWARIHKRTSRLGYIKGGFQHLADSLVKAIQKHGGNVLTNCTITAIQAKSEIGVQKTEVRGQKTKYENSSFLLQTSDLRHPTSYFDRILLTVPSPVASKLIKFPKAFEHQMNAIDHLAAQMLVLETKEPILEKTYWLNVNDRAFPFIAVVAHTNFMDKKEYGGHHITYIGNYLPAGHPYLTMTKDQLFKKFEPFIHKINPNFTRNSNFVSRYSFSVPHAQPVHTRHYSQKVPLVKTPIPGVYLANLDTIVPWDRGINFAIELGQKAANNILNNI